MTKGVTIIRSPEKIIPSDYLAKAASDNSGWGACLISDKGTRINVKRMPKATPAAEVEKFLANGGVKNAHVIMHFAKAVPLGEEDQQPYVLLQNDDDTNALAVFLDGDFSLYEEEGMSNELCCVQKEIYPRVEKLITLTDGDLDKIMDFLADEQTTHDWTNFMVGQRGSITIVSCTGRIHTISVKGDETQKQFDGWWTSNTLGYGDVQKTEAPAARPRLKLASKTIPTVASTTPVAQPKPATPAAPTAKPVSKPQAEPVQTTGPQLSEAARKLGDPNASLYIAAPTDCDDKKLFKFWSKRLPEGMAMPKVLRGLKGITCKRSEATPAFLQTYVEQNKLGGLNLIAAYNGKAKSSTAIPSVEPKKTELPQVAAHKRPMPIMAAAKKQGQYPPKAEAPAVDPSKAPQPEVAEPPVETEPQVVTEPRPLFSPIAKEELLTYTGSIKEAMDARGKKIGSPQGLASEEKKIETFAQQFGNKLTLSDIAKFEWDDLRKWVHHAGVDTTTNLLFLFAFEYWTMEKMLEELTKPKAEAKQEVQQPAPRKAAFVMPRRKTG